MRETNSPQLISVFFLALFLFIIYILVKIFSPFLGALFWAAILAYAFYPLHKRTRKSFGKYQSLAAGFMTALIIAFITPFIVIIVVRLSVEIAELSRFTAHLVQSGQVQLWVQDIAQSPWFQRIGSSALPWEEITANAKSWLLEMTKAMGGVTFSTAVSFTKNFFFFIFNMILTIVIIFFFLRDGERLYNFVYELVPLERTNKERISAQVQDTLTSIIHGNLLIAFLKGVMTGITFWILSLPLPIFIGMISFIMSMIPAVGTYVVWFPFVVYLAIQQEFIKAAVLFGIGSLIVGSIDNVLYPYLIGQKTKAPFLFLFLGILGGMAVYGIEGMFIGPAVVSLFMVLVGIYRLRYTESGAKKRPPDLGTSTESRR